MSKDNLFGGLLEYKEPKEKSIKIAKPGKIASGGKIKAFKATKVKTFKPTKVKTPHFSQEKAGFQITNVPKHESGWM